MSSSRSVFAAVMVVAWISLSGARPAAGADAPPLITSPKDGQHVGGAGDANCPEPKQPCFKIRVEGWTPEKKTPVLAVQPLGGRIWIQPAIHGVRSDGTLSGLVYLGEATNGVGQSFKIYLLACPDSERLHEGDVFMDLPENCVASEPVEVYRER